jgi:hypothetical protein
MSRSARVASDLDKYPEPKTGLVFRYDYLRPRELAEGVEHGKDRPACILLPLIEGETLQNVSVIDEASKRTTANYVAGKNDIVIICIQTDPPAKDQLGVKLDLSDSPSGAIRYAIAPYGPECDARRTCASRDQPRRPPVPM